MNSIWIGLLVVFTASLLLFTRRFVPSILVTWCLFLAVTLLNSFIFTILWWDPLSLYEYQFWIDLVFISSIFQQTWFGVFRWTYTVAAILWEYLVYQCLSALLLPYFGKAMIQEISFSGMNAVFGAALLWRIVARSDSFYRNYRFWMTTAITAYYCLGFMAFVIEYNAVANDLFGVMSWSNGITLHEIGFGLNCIFALLGMAIWYFKIGGIQKMREVFLLPRWIERKILFWEVPRLANDNRSEFELSD